MKIYCKDEFWDQFYQLPAHIQKQTNRAFERLTLDPRYPSLHFKCVNQQKSIYSVRIGRKDRALGVMTSDEVI